MVKCEARVVQLIHSEPFQRKYRVFGADGVSEAMNWTLDYLKEMGMAYGIGGIDKWGNRLISMWANCVRGGGNQVWDVVTSHEPVSQNKE